MTAAERRALLALADLHGVCTAYEDVTGQRVQATTESLKAVLRALGVAIHRDADLPRLFSEERGNLWQRSLEPVQTAWEGRLTSIDIRLPENLWNKPCRLTIHYEETTTASASRMKRPHSSDAQGIDLSLARARVVEQAVWKGQKLQRRVVEYHGKLPLGYHRLVLETAGGQSECLILSAPEKAFAATGRKWGLFSPLYALRHERSWGSGSFSDLERLIAWEAKQGASLVSTLPLLPAFLDKPFEPSPYSPVSRLFWNEFYVDVERAPEFKASRRAQALVRSFRFQQQLDALRSADVVKYREGMALKRQVLERLSQEFFAQDSARRRKFERFALEHPSLECYARFRAVADKRGAGWTQWPERLREGELRAADFDAAVARYYRYTQWIAHEQMNALSTQGERSGVQLYLDMPLGVHSDGFDTWSEKGLFALHASGGAPPDAVYTKGQDWGFAPLHPQRSREQGYRYMIAYLRHHLARAKVLRLDHVMGVHRLFWVPQGLSAAEGAYVSYPYDEIYAVLNLESHRHRSVVVGENLGTVPPAVNSNMQRHGIREMFVVQYELRPDAKKPLRPVPSQAVASLNTHDMFPFSAFWEDMDIADRLDLGLMDGQAAAAEKVQRRLMREALLKLLKRKRLLPKTGASDILTATLALLASGPAEFVLVNLEDLWRETASQNVPGTTGERVNWRRKARLSLERLRADPAVAAALRVVARHRPGKHV